MRVVSVVAGGWSFNQCDHLKLPGLVIAVNDAAYYMESRRPDHIVSMDRMWTEHRLAFLRLHKKETHIRFSACKNIPWFELQAEGWFTTFNNTNSGVPFNETPEVLNGANSGACALNLAYTMKPEQLFLFGFDMNAGPDGNAYWYPPYPWSHHKGGKGNYTQWALDMENYAKQFVAIGCSVCNVSKTSAIKSWPRVSPKDVGCAL